MTPHCGVKTPQCGVKTPHCNVFKLLLGIYPNSPYRKTGYEDIVNLFAELGISSVDWYLLMSFLNNGFPPYYMRYNLTDSNKNENLFNLLIETIETLNRVNITLGGIPSFDHFYKNFYEKEMAIIEKYNPITPEDDYKNLYDWALDDSESYRSSSLRVDFHNSLDKNFQPVNVFTVNNTTPFTLKWYRKLKE